MGPGIRRQDGETWLGAALRLAARSRLKGRVRRSYGVARKRGVSEEEAALAAAVEWDVAEILYDDGDA